VEAIMPRKRGGGTEFLDALPTDGERRLMLAVLIDAIRALQHHRPSAPSLRMSRAWLRDRAWLQADNHSNPFSFVNICSALGLEAGYVRRCVLGPTSPQRQVNVRRYAARAEASWLRQRKDGMGCGLSFDNRPAQAIVLHANQSAR
jgi:hypothetical protein